MFLHEVRKKKEPVDYSPLGQLKKLPQPIGINGGSYTYWVDVTKSPLKFTASDGSEIDKAKTLEDIAKWMDKWAAQIWLEFLNGDEDLEMLKGEGIIRARKGRGDQQEHEGGMSEGFSLGSKAHHDAVAAAQGKDQMTWRKLIQRIKKSTMSDRDMDAALDEIHTAYGHERALDKQVRRQDLEQLSAIADVDLGELLELAGM